MSLGRNDESGRTIVVEDRDVGFATGIMPHAELVAVSTAVTSVSFTTPVTLYAGTSGTIRVTTAGGETLTFPAWPAHQPLPARVETVYHSGTSASDLVAVW